MTIERNKIYNMDCLEGMKAIPDGSVDCIICDLPYGTMKGIGQSSNLNNCEWDTIIPTDQLFEQYERVLRRGGTAVLFSQEPYTSHLRTFKARNMKFCQPCIWLKDLAGNALNAKYACLNYFEDINIFTKANPLKHEINWEHPLRSYFAKVLEYIGKPKKAIMEVLGSRADHTFRCDSSQFALCTEETYDEMISQYHIDQMPGFRTYADLKDEDTRFGRMPAIPKEHERTFNLPTGAASLSNVFQFRKDTDTFHPTQKPVGLIQRLVLTYSNPGDLILDNCMGSGTTAIACIREKRDFIGFEMNKEYYEKSLKRIEVERMQPRLL